MSSYILLELDTTEPNIEILAPTYTIPDIITEITIQSDEEIDLYQEVYIVDSNGNTHILNCSYDGDSLIYQGYLNQLSFGTAIIYARIRDIVHNQSALVNKSISILESNVYKIKQINKVSSLKIENKVNNLSIKNKKNSLLIGEIKE